MTLLAQDGMPIQDQSGGPILQQAPITNYRNLLINGDFSDGLNNWIQVDAGNRIITGNVSRELSTGQSLTGGSNDLLGQDYQEGTFTAGVHSTYYISGWFGNSFNDTDRGYVRLRLYDSVDTELTNVIINNTQADVGPFMKFEELSGPIPATAEKWRVDVYTDRNNGTGNNCTIQAVYLEFDRPNWDFNVDRKDEYVVARLDFEGTQGATTVTDKARENWTEWEVGGSASIAANDGPFPGMNSLRFTGDTDYLRSIGLPSLPGDYKVTTLEFWIRYDALSATQGMFIFGKPADTNAARWQCNIGNDGGFDFFMTDDDGNTFSGRGDRTVAETGMSPNTWHFITAVADGRALYWFVDGVWQRGGMLYSGTNVSAVHQFMSELWLGTARITNNQEGMVGNIADVRITHGHSVHRYLRNFTPPTGPLPIPAIEDTALSYDPFDDSLCRTLNFRWHDIISDESGGNRGTWGGGAIWDRQCPVEKWGTSQAAYFDGDGAYIRLDNYPNLGSLMRRKFTFEAWVYLESYGSDVRTILSTRDDTITANGGFQIHVSHTTNKLTLWAWDVDGNNAFASWPESTNTVPLDEWVYVAIEGDGGGTSTGGHDLFLNVNGTVAGPFTTTSAIGFGDGSYGWVGAQQLPVADARSWDGWISEMRLTNGKQVWGWTSAGVTTDVPTKPFPRLRGKPDQTEPDDEWDNGVFNVITAFATTNTAFVRDQRGYTLWDFVNSARADTLASLDQVDAVNNPTLSHLQGRLLRTQAGGDNSLVGRFGWSLPDIGTQAFCYECIALNVTGHDSSARIFKSHGEEDVDGFMVIMLSDERVRARVTTSGSSWDFTLDSGLTDFADGAWAHIVLERDDVGETRLIIDGVVVAQATITGSIVADRSLKTHFGGSSTSTNRSFNGWHMQHRLCIGSHRYGGAFTPIVDTTSPKPLPWGNSVFLTPPGDPVITVQPQPQTIDEFSTANFNISATGNDPLTYQWYDNVTGLLSGETGTTLTLTNVPFSFNGRLYYCIVTDFDGDTTQSNSVLLTVNDIAHPVITQQPVDQLVQVGNPATFTVVATSVSALTYQWYEVNVGIMVGETSDQITIVANSSDAGREFYVDVSDIYGQTTTSDTAGIVIVAAPVIVQQPSDAEEIEYRDHTFGVVANGDGPFTYSWYNDVDGLLVADSPNNFYTFATALADNGKNYYVIVEDVNMLTTQSDNALLTVTPSLVPNNPPFLDIDITGPNDVVAEVGASVQYSVQIGSQIAVDPIQIDWYNSRDGLLQSGADDTYTFTTALADNGLDFWVIITDDNGQQGQSRVASLILTGATLNVEWSITTPEVIETIVQYQNIGWSVFDAFTESQQGDFSCPVRAHRGLFDDGRTYWIPFYDLSARCSRGPLVNDAFNRYYWTQDNEDMKYAPLQNLELDSRTTGAVVGVPAPRVSPKLAAPTGDNLETRAYVYTYVTIYGEEGPPSTPVVRTGDADGRWVLSEMETGPTDDKLRRITTKRVYRTVSGQGGDTSYFFVAALPLQVTKFTDTRETEDVSLNSQLESTNWFPPPEQLSGLIAHPNGFFIGFVGRDIYMSEPYRPHAWNPAYQVSTLADVVGFGIYGTTVVVCTESYPYTLTGIHPGSMALEQHDTPEPCVSRYGIVSMPFGVYFPGPNGLMLASPRGFENATQQLMTKEEWQNRYNVTQLDAAQYQSQYVAFYSPTKGVMFAPDEPMAALVDLDLTGSSSEPDQMQSIFTDEYSGRTYLIEDCDMFEWNPVSGAPLEYDWTSMEFDAADPVNFGAARIIWYSRYTPPTEAQTQAWRDWNVARMAAAPLNPFNSHALNVSRDVDPVGFETFDEIKQPFHWSPLIWVPILGEPWPNTPRVVMELIANEEVVFTQEIDDTGIFRLPSGWKATRFKIRLRSNVPIQSCKVAETGKELARV